MHIELHSQVDRGGHSGSSRLAQRNNRLVLTMNSCRLGCGGFGEGVANAMEEKLTARIQERGALGETDAFSE
jgi:hypothetical protein